MIQSLKWLSLQKRRRDSRLILLFKFLNRLIHIPTRYLPAPFLLNISLELIIIKNLCNCMQEQIDIIIRFYQGQLLTGIIYVLEI